MAEQIQANDLLNISTFHPEKVTQKNHLVMLKLRFTSKLESLKYKIVNPYQKKTPLVLFI